MNYGHVIVIFFVVSVAWSGLHEVFDDHLSIAAARASEVDNTPFLLNRRHKSETVGRLMRQLPELNLLVISFFYFR